MTYDRMRHARMELTLHGVVVSHPAEPVRGECIGSKAPSSAPSGRLLPKGRRAAAASEGADKETRT